MAASRKRSLVIAIVLLAVGFFFSDALFSIFSAGIPIATTSAACTGTISTGPIGQADCLGYGPVAVGSSLDPPWGFSTAGEGTITLPEPSSQITLTGRFKNINGAVSLMIYNYNIGAYQNIGFIFKGVGEEDLQSRVFGSDYIDSLNHTIIKFKWDMACPASQCFAGAEQLKVTQYDTIAVITTTSTSTSSTTIIGNASSGGSQITSSTVMPAASTTTTILLSGGQQIQIGGFSNQTILIIAVVLVALVLYLMKKQGGR